MCREKQRCLPTAELDKHLHFSDSENKSNKKAPDELPPLLRFIQLIWSCSEIHFYKYSQAINWTMNILSSKAHIPAAVSAAASATFLRGRPLWRRLRSARVRQALLFSHMTGGVMAVCKILAALLRAEKKGRSDLHHLCSGAFASEWAVGSPPSAMPGLGWPKSTGISFSRCFCGLLSVLVFLKIWSFLLESTCVVGSCLWPL